MQDLDSRLRLAVQHFWQTRARQAERQGAGTGTRDAGSRTAVTGGAQMDGFINLIRELLIEGGIEAPSVYCKQRIELPGFFRPEKQWDLLVAVDGQLLATVEVKSQVGSFGNNYNNRTEEAIGSAADLRTAYREGAFKPSPSPWLGYLFLLEDAPGSRRPVGVKEPHFKVFEEFHGASYAKRYEILLTKLIRERLYDAACLLLSDRETGLTGAYQEPSLELTFDNFASSLSARILAYTKRRR